MGNAYRVGWGMLLVLAMLSAAAGHAGEAGAIVVGNKAPRFRATTLAGEPLDLEELTGKGRAVVVNFWGLRCGSCIQEIPHLNALSAKFGDRLRILGVNVDGVDAESLKGHMARMGLKMDYAVVPDPELALADLFRMTAAPLTIVVDPRGIVRAVHENYQEGDEKGLEQEIRTMLEAPDAGPR